MEKKQYIVPFVETMRFGAEVVMHAVGGEASLPNGNMAPGRRVPVLGNDSVKAF